MLYWDSIFCIVYSALFILTNEGLVCWGPMASLGLCEWISYASWMGVKRFIIVRCIGKFRLTMHIAIRSRKWWYDTIQCYLLLLLEMNRRCWQITTRAPIQYKDLTNIGNPIVGVRRSYDHLISTMGFPILVRWHLYIESGPSIFQ